MFQNFKSWLNADNAAQPKPRRFAMKVEALQDRVVPTAFVNLDGNLQINCGNGADTVTVSVNYVQPTSKGSTGGGLSIGPMVGSNMYQVVENGVTTKIAVERVTGGKIIFNGLDGNDLFENRTLIGAVADGGAGDDTLIGGSKPDTLLGGLGSDVLRGNGGADLLLAGNYLQNDEVTRNDLRGGDGADTIYGAAGSDFIDGGYGADYLVGNRGNDRIYAAYGVTDFSTDVLRGDSGNDSLYGGAGSDYLYGEGGNDLMGGAGGNDYLLGGEGADSLLGGAGNDTLDGGGGFGDRLYGGTGFDTATTLAGRALVSESESVRVTNVPTDDPQTDFWGCGPSSGSRFLRAYNFEVSYAKFRSDIESEGVISDFGLGTTSDTLLDALRRYRPGTKQEKSSNTGRMMELLLEGKPVIALVSMGKQFIGIGSVAKLHYVVMTGYDKATDTFQYTNTNGAQETWTRAQFEAHWDWHADFTYGGEAAQAALYPLGMRNRTLFY